MSKSKKKKDTKKKKETKKSDETKKKETKKKVEVKKEKEIKPSEKKSDVKKKKETKKPEVKKPSKIKNKIIKCTSRKSFILTYRHKDVCTKTGVCTCTTKRKKDGSMERMPKVQYIFAGVQFEIPEIMLNHSLIRKLRYKGKISIIR